MVRRFPVGLLLVLCCGLLVGYRPDAAAQNPKDKKDSARENLLERQLKAAQQDIAQGERLVAALRQQVNQLEAQNRDLTVRLGKERKDDKSDNATIKALQTTLDGYRRAGLVHVVVLKLKSGAPKSEVKSLLDDAYSQLPTIKTVRGLWAGAPTTKGTPQAVTDYTVTLAVAFDDATGLQRYLDDPVHTKFAEKHLKRWEAPVVYDFEPRK